ncbi:MAG: MarR family winged helix-turn-helix transcriptional regulator [Candidatus Eisenbacteria bacterium]|uniref:Winged helix-turn-helix transcriptional regulator n=1 Tax=Eiseniibacteriota bacterium TaxID=2212470 RepID=A0A956LWN1_UNCEI|nr:winged helix-turn-helix transcriptional regulator [Candidatus Eisenbacteria bacterium]
MDNARTSDLLERLGALIRAERRRLAAAHDLKLVQLDALAYLARANRYSDSPAAVTDWLGSTKGTVSQTVGVLERKGLVEKRDDPDDRRRVHLQLTKAGRRVLKDTDPAPLLTEAIARIGGDGGLAERLMILLRELQRRSGARSFGICNTCRFFGREDDRFRCGLTGERLSVDDSELICREHESAARGAVAG